MVHFVKGFSISMHLHYFSFLHSPSLTCVDANTESSSLRALMLGTANGILVELNWKCGVCSVANQPSHAPLYYFPFTCASVHLCSNYHPFFAVTFLVSIWHIHWPLSRRRRLLNLWITQIVTQCSVVFEPALIMLSGRNKRLKQFYQTSPLGQALVRKHNYSLAEIQTIVFKIQTGNKVDVSKYWADGSFKILLFKILE